MKVVICLFGKKRKNKIELCLAPTLYLFQLLPGLENLVYEGLLSSLAASGTYAPSVNPQYNWDSMSSRHDNLT